MSNTLFGNRSKRARDEPPRTKHATCTFRVRQNKIIQVLEHFLRGKKVSLFHVKFQWRFVEGICGCFWPVTLSTTQCHFNQLLCVCQVSGKKKKKDDLVASPFESQKIETLSFMSCSVARYGVSSTVVLYRRVEMVNAIFQRNCFLSKPSHRPGSY